MNRILILAAFLTACGTPAAPAPPSDAQIQTAAAEILTASAPTATLEPEYNEAEQAYLDVAIPSYNSLDAAFEDFLAKNQEAVENFSLIYNDEWTLEMAAILVRLEISCEDFFTIQKWPVSWAGVHSSISNACSEARVLAENYAQGIDNIDIPKMELALQNVSNVSRALLNAEAAMGRLGIEP